MKKPVSRLLINTPAALGGVGATTNLPPAFTLGCGTVGGSATSDSIGPLNLINKRRIAYGSKELDDIKDPSLETKHTSNYASIDKGNDDKVTSTNDVEAIIRKVLGELYNK